MVRIGNFEFENLESAEEFMENEVTKLTEVQNTLLKYEELLINDTKDIVNGNIKVSEYTFNIILDNYRDFQNEYLKFESIWENCYELYKNLNSGDGINILNEVKATFEIFKTVFSVTVDLMKLRLPQKEE